MISTLNRLKPTTLGFLISFLYLFACHISYIWHLQALRRRFVTKFDKLRAYVNGEVIQSCIWLSVFILFYLFYFILFILFSMYVQEV